MWVQKYDYSALKLEFFESDYDEVSAFLTNKWLTSKINRTDTAGRSKDKKERKEKIVEKALERRQNELAKKLEIPMERLLEAKKTSIQLVRKKLQAIIKKTQEDWDLVDLKELETIWKMSKTELWEPTTVSKNENMNNNRDSISFEDKEMIDNYFKNKN